MIAHSEWKQDEVFEGTAENGNTITFDADSAHKHGPSPMEAVLMALCSCTSVDVVSILKKKRQPLTGLRVSANGDAGPCSAPRLHAHQAHLRGPRKAEPQSRRRRSFALQKQILLRLEDAGEGRDDRIRNRLSRRRTGAMSRGFFIRFFRMASVVMLLVAAALLSAITTMHFAIHGAEVKIPALKGMTVAEARSQAAGMGLNLDVDNRYYSADVAAGHILSQSPRAGHRGAPRMACARRRKPRSAEGRRPRHGRHRSTRSRIATAPRRP